MKHHNNRCNWAAEKEADLLMVGDSIVFGWSRIGQPVWDEFYADRKAVNIGSSSDQTKHMLMPIFPRGNNPQDQRRIYNEDGTIKKELMPDGLHPNISGYRVWAEAMETTIQ